jgi:hypothetical protein
MFPAFTNNHENKDVSLPRSSYYDIVKKPPEAIAEYQEIDEEDHLGRS